MKILTATAIVVLLLLRTASASEGERLVYMLGCVNCHHQTPKEIINAPPLLIVRGYSLEDFTKLLRTGRTSSGRDLLGIGSIMGIVAAEQFSFLTDDEIRLVYEYLHNDWTHQRAVEEEAKIRDLYKHEIAEPE